VKHYFASVGQPRPKERKCIKSIAGTQGNISIELGIVDVKWTIGWIGNLKDQFAAPVFKKSPGRVRVGMEVAAING
jgi:hypothetical protein